MQSERIWLIVYNDKQLDLLRDYQAKYQIAEKEHELQLQEQKNHQSRRLLAFAIAMASMFLALAVISLRYATQRKRQTDMLKRLNQTKDHLFSVVSHDIKTPVMMQKKILDMTYAHFDEMKPEQLKNTLFLIKSSSKELKDKMLNIIQWVKGELGDNKSQASRFNLRDMAEKVLKSYSWQMGMKSLNADNAVPADWYGYEDVKMVEMVLQNILSNAIKFSPTGGTVSIGMVKEDDRYWVEVADQGEGIGEEKLSKLMKSFVDPEYGTGGEMGTGIGLFVSQQLLKRNGEDIRIESKEGQGTQVFFSIKQYQNGQ